MSLPGVGRGFPTPNPGVKTTHHAPGWVDGVLGHQGVLRLWAGQGTAYPNTGSSGQLLNSLPLLAKLPTFLSCTPTVYLLGAQPSCDCHLRTQPLLPCFQAKTIDLHEPPTHTQTTSLSALPTSHVPLGTCS